MLFTFIESASSDAIKLEGWASFSRLSKHGQQKRCCHLILPLRLH